MFQKLFAFFIDVVDAEECAGKGGGLAESYQKGLVDLSLRVNEDATEEENQPSDGEDKRCYELEFDFHKFFVLIKEQGVRSKE